MFDPFTIGRIRYIDRDNGAGLLFQGSAAGRKFTWDFARISLPRLWAGPNFDGSYPCRTQRTAQTKWAQLDVRLRPISSGSTTSGRGRDLSFDDGRDCAPFQHRLGPVRLHLLTGSTCAAPTTDRRRVHRGGRARLLRHLRLLAGAGG
jgi:hypothetical protein